MAKPTALSYAAPPEAEAYDVGLRFEGGGSDKVYMLAIERAGEGWVVNYANGRRGGTLATGTKTKVPCGYAEAAKICNAALSEKVAKGYLPVSGSRLDDGAVARAIATVEKASSGVVPQLSNPVPDGDLQRYMDDDRFVAQVKFNGDRRLLIVRDGKAVGGNRKGQTVALPGPVARAAETLGRDVVLDGELCGDVLHFWDVLAIDGRDVSRLPLEDRLDLLPQGDSVRDGALRRATTGFGAAGKRALLKSVRDGKLEGLVFKDRRAPYVAGRPNSGGASMKYKLYNTLSAVVGKANQQRSVSLELVGADGARIKVGNVTIPPNASIPEPESVVEVRYLFAFQGGSITQAVYLGPRSDVDPSECLADQRVFEGAPAEEEAEVAGMRM